MYKEIWLITMKHRGPTLADYLKRVTNLQATRTNKQAYDLSNRRRYPFYVPEGH